MANAAWSPVNVCGTQLNRLDEFGTILERADGDDNVVVTCAFVDITRTEVVGNAVEQTDASGSGGYCAVRRRPARTTGYDYSLTMCSRIDAEMMSLLGLVDTVVDSLGNVVGYKARDIAGAACDCDPTQSSQAGVCMHVWSLAWKGEEPHPDHPYVIEAIPKIVFAPGGDRKKSAEFNTSTVSGSAAKNSSYGRGPGAIYPESGGLDRVWADWLTSTPPPNQCNCDYHGYRTLDDGVGVPVPIETAGS